ncbi:hypothetical protein VII00023_19159 [Vibrio ichthyoenteri ATCC 700023]|uniref:Uncharacterized protein n=1 Tax=Vibrio ichthyoenteri ATCC 700023 TaxID=870968 RepID=F9S7X5_9VIBR|nr:hypothetical protein [Vibrio ichthyoenteri]EGU30710.1 hypothetical protein VII00023_19159 [Vibrio ichthyoenteri ATCC 700023]
MLKVINLKIGEMSSDDLCAVFEDNMLAKDSIISLDRDDIYQLKEPQHQYLSLFSFTYDSYEELEVCFHDLFIGLQDEVAACATYLTTLENASLDEFESYCKLLTFSIGESRILTGLSMGKSNSVNLFLLHSKPIDN